MNWLTRLLPTRGDTPALDDELRTRLQAWQALAEPDLGRPHFEAAYTVLNTEATGLDLDKDTMLAVGAIRVDGGRFSPADGYYAPLSGQPAAALAGLLHFVGKGPVVVFNTGFNRVMLERALATHLDVAPTWQWLDLRVLLPALFPERIDRPARLADWMRAFSIETFQRHHALGDCWAIAQLFLAAQSRAMAQGAAHARALGDLERARRQLWRQP
ncbi:PolC-type DNA polymerase III [Azoarcus olearius]|uniref:DNA-directed DNA polymerase n=1 Tax=Azoarcus sp. (strain BH72) TaxID=418699 RepID=A1K7L4_AZOSB|nr:3'-5' exonuclease [Azoarcus olearius]ANQ85366.1 DNA-directed DNA polymerase [Azoarcus olearius]CAL94819.1 DNA-directed DNA polymerase [Azoarcus olearius]